MKSKYTVIVRIPDHMTEFRCLHVEAETPQLAADAAVDELKLNNQNYSIAAVLSGHHCSLYND